MNTQRLALVAIAALMGAAAAQAETYEGVHPLTSAASRAEVQAEAVAAARNGNAYSDAAGAGSLAVASTADRAAVRAQAVAAAHDPLRGARRDAFFRDQLPAQYGRAPVTLTRQAGL